MANMVKKISLTAMTAFYFWAGLNHFWHTSDYLRIMPPYLPYPLLLVQISGVAESFFGDSFALAPNPPLGLLRNHRPSDCCFPREYLYAYFRRGRHDLSSLGVGLSASFTRRSHLVGLLA